MTRFFLDTSAVVKLYLPELGTAWIRALCEPASGNTIALSELTLVKVAAALAARHRASAGISRRARDDALALFRRHMTNEYAVTAISRRILERAADPTQRHRLRGYDAAQLATVLAAHAALTAAGQPGLTLVAADGDLLAAARAEGPAADDPQLHP